MLRFCEIEINKRSTEVQYEHVHSLYEYLWLLFIQEPQAYPILGCIYPGQSYFINCNDVFCKSSVNIG